VTPLSAHVVRPLRGRCAARRHPCLPAEGLRDQGETGRARQDPGPTSGRWRQWREEQLARISPERALASPNSRPTPRRKRLGHLLTGDVA
jgi:hypothetical protein